MELFFGYLNAPNPEDPEVSPLLAKNFRSLPCTYMQIAGMDPLRDEGLAYADKLRAAGSVPDPRSSISNRLPVYL